MRKYWLLLQIHGSCLASPLPSDVFQMWRRCQAPYHQMFFRCGEESAPDTIFFTSSQHLLYEGWLGSYHRPRKQHVLHIFYTSALGKRCEKHVWKMLGDFGVLLGKDRVFCWGWMHTVWTCSLAWMEFFKKFLHLILSNEEI